MNKEIESTEHKVYVKYKLENTDKCRAYHTHPMNYNDACELARIFRKQPNVIHAEVVGNYR